MVIQFDGITSLTDTENKECSEIISYLYSLDKYFVSEVTKVIQGVVHWVLDGASSLDELESVEKTIIGIKVQTRLMKRYNIPHGLILDTKLADHEVDIKFTIGNNWMLGPEIFGHWCLLITLAGKVGIFKAKPEHLTNGGNRDKKKTINKQGKQHILWLQQ